MSLSLVTALFLRRIFPDDDDLPAIDYSAPDDLIAALPKKVWSNSLKSNSDENSSENLYEQSSCAICLGDYEQGEELTVLPCNHTFHAECVTEWLHTRNKCPLCCSVLALESGEVCIQKPEPAASVGSYEPPTEIQLEVDSEEVEGEDEEESEESNLLNSDATSIIETLLNSSHSDSNSGEVDDDNHDSDNDSDERIPNRVTLNESARSRFATVFSRFFGMNSVGDSSISSNGDDAAADSEENEFELPLLEQ